MATAPQGLAIAPGIIDYDSLNFTFSPHGTEPSAMVFQTYPERLGQLSGRPFPVELRYENIVLQFPDCKLDQGGASFSENGTRVTLRILDHRWRWAFAKTPFTIHANRRIGKKIISDTKRSARQLAVELLRSAGETRHDVSLVPGNDYPEADITGITPPMVALQELLSKYGLRICYVPNQAFVRIVRPGQGGLLPDNSWLAFPSFTLDPPELPDRFMLIGSPVVFHCTFELEAVGEDRDGKVHNLDDLPYAPDGGWKNTYPESIGDNITDKKDKLAAQKSVFKMYRIKRTEDSKDGESLAKWLEQFKDRHGKPIDVTKIEQFLPLIGQLSDVEELPDGTERPKRAKLTGNWYEWKVDTREDKQNLDEGEYPGGWSLDGDRGIVITSEPAILMDQNDKEKGPIKPAKLVLECTFNLRTAPEESYLRPVYERRLSNSGAGIKLFSRDDLRRVIKFVDKKLEDGESEFTEAAEVAALEVQSSMVTERGAVALYNRIEPLDPDGAIQQFVYSISDAGATTLVSRNFEWSRVAPQYAMRRRIAFDNAKLEL